MANQDIIPFASPHGGHSTIRPYKIAASTSFATAETSWLKGEVTVVTAGAVGAANAVIANGATNHNPAIHMIAVASSQGEMSLGLFASAAATINALAGFNPVLGEQEYMTRNLYNNSNVRVVPLLTHVGDICGWWRDNTTSATAPNGTFGLDTNGTGLIITRVLNANYEDIGDHGGTGTFVVFKCNGE